MNGEEKKRVPTIIQGDKCSVDCDDPVLLITDHDKKRKNSLKYDDSD